MKRTLIWGFFILCSFFLTNCNSKSDKGNKKDGILSIFKRKIGTEYTDSSSIDSIINLHKELVDNKIKVHHFYQKRNYELAWSEHGEFLPQADMMVNMVHNVRAHGVKPFSDPNLRQLFREVEYAKKPRKEIIVKKRKAMDVLLTALYFEYAEEIWKGKISHEDKLGWHIDRKKIQEGRTLEAILATDQTNKENLFLQYEPLYPEYNNLKRQLSEYVLIKNNGGWPIIHVSENLSFKLGDTSQAVFLLKKRLAVTKDYRAKIINNRFDPELDKAIRRFQRRHGLEITGTIDPKTLNTLNVPVGERIKQIIVNMERWRWIPEKLTPDFVWVNIPEFKLHVIEGNKEIWTMDVIVGKAATSTPIFNDEIEYIVFSPSWNIPEKIAVEEIVPIIKADSSYLVDQQMEILQNNQPIDPHTIDWNNVREEELKKYTFRQKPGERNALGNVKFLFPNEYDVYLHDTPSNHLFKRTERGFSHGCIRIAEPVKFAQYLLRNDSTWTKQKIEDAMNSETEQYVKLKVKEPVYIVYFTAWTEPDGTMNFRDDIYGHDKKLTKLFFDDRSMLP
jgi:murein L,D-transpeptidase YcbB/YkuD